MADVSVTFGASIKPLLDGIEQAKRAIETIEVAPAKDVDGFKRIEVIGHALLRPADGADSA